MSHEKKGGQMPGSPSGQSGPTKGRIFVPVDPLNPHETEMTLMINGEAYTLPLGRLVTLPEPFCRLLVDSGRAAGYEQVAR